MKQHKLGLIKIAFSVAVVLLPVVVIAQTGPSDPSDTTSGVPIDGGLSLLMGAGALYAVRRMKKK